MWADAIEVLEECREELAVVEAQIRFHRLATAAGRVRGGGAAALGYHSVVAFPVEVAGTRRARRRPVW